MRNLFLGLFPIITLTFCKPANDTEHVLDHDTKAQIQYQCTKTLFDYFAAIKKNGLKTEFDYLDNSEDFLWVPPGYNYALPYDSVADILTRNAGMYRSVENVWGALYVNPMSYDLTAYNGTIDSYMTDTAGHKLHLKLIETGLMRKKNGKWKLLCGQTTMVAP